MASGIRPLKRFSQNFLKDPGFAKRLVEAFGIGPGDTVLEIGPGEGILTRALLSSSAERVIAVEIDRRCADWLRREFGKDARFLLIERDFLKTEIEPLCPANGKFRVVGNIPYAITSPILFRLLELRSCIRDFALTVQKEVAERVCSPPGSKVYGIPSVLFQVHCDVRILFTIPPGVFRPVPAVDSSVLFGSFYESPKYALSDEAFFRTLVKTAFGQRRKMLRNTLKAYPLDGIGSGGSMDFLERRPESLSVAEWVSLANRIHSRI